MAQDIGVGSRADHPDGAHFAVELSIQVLCAIDNPLIAEYVCGGTLSDLGLLRSAIRPSGGRLASYKMQVHHTGAEGAAGEPAASGRCTFHATELQHLLGLLGSAPVFKSGVVHCSRRC